MKSEFSHLKVLLVLDRIPYPSPLAPFGFFFLLSCNTKDSAVYARELLQGEQQNINLK